MSRLFGQWLWDTLTTLKTLQSESQIAISLFQWQFCAFFSLVDIVDQVNFFWTRRFYWILSILIKFRTFFNFHQFISIIPSFINFSVDLKLKSISIAYLSVKCRFFCQPVIRHRACTGLQAFQCQFGILTILRVNFLKCGA